MTPNQKSTLATIGTVVAIICLIVFPWVTAWLIGGAVALFALFLAGMGIRDIWCGFKSIFE